MIKRLLFALLGVAFALVMMSGARDVFGQTTALMPPIKAQFFNATGTSPCSLCQVFTYAAGTTLPLVTYQSSGLASQNTNPVILNTAGQANIWLSNTSYKIVVKTSLGVTLYTVDNVTGPGLANVTGSGTAQYIPMWTTATGLINTTGPLYEASGPCLSYGQAGCDDGTQISFNAIQASNTGRLIVVRNPTQGVASYAAFTARAGTSGSEVDATMGITSTLYTDGNPQIVSHQMFLMSGTSASGGMLLRSKAGPIKFNVADHSGAGEYSFSTDGAFRLIATSAAALSATGESALRNNAGSLEFSNNGSAWAAVGAGGGGGSWTEAGAYIYPTTTTRSVLIGMSTTSFAGSGLTVLSTTANAGGLAVSSSAASDASAVSIGLSPAGGYVNITSTKGSGGTAVYLPIDFELGGSKRMRMQTDGTMSLGTTADSIYGLDLQGTLNVSGTTRLNGITYTWPASDVAGTQLTTDGVGGLTWSAGSGTSALTGSGTTGKIVMWTGGTSLGNSVMTQGGSSLTYEVSSNSSIDFISYNPNVAGTAARAVFKATSDAGSVYYGVTSSNYTFIGSATANQAFVATVDAAISNGLLFKTVAGPMLFRPGHGVVGSSSNALLTLSSDYAVELTDTSTAAVGAAGTVRMRNNGGTLEVSQNGAAYSAIGVGGGITCAGCTSNLVIKYNGSNGADSSIFDSTTTTIGTGVASDETTNIRFQVQKNQNESTIALVRNETSDTLAQVGVAVRSGASSSTRDLTMHVTSAGFTTVNNIPASSGVINTGAQTTGGLYIQTAAGNINFMVGGTTVNYTFSNTGTLTATAFAGVGASLTSLNAANLIGAVPIANGGTAATSFTSNRTLYYNGSAFASGPFSYSGGDTNLLAGSLNVEASGNGIRMASTGSGSGVGFGGTSTTISAYIGSTEVFQLQNPGSSTTVIPIYTLYNGSIQQVKLGDCTVAGGTHKCLYLN